MRREEGEGEKGGGERRGSEGRTRQRRLGGGREGNKERSDSWRTFFSRLREGKRGVVRGAEEGGGGRGVEGRASQIRGRRCGKAEEVEEEGNE